MQLCFVARVDPVDRDRINCCDSPPPSLLPPAPLLVVRFHNCTFRMGILVFGMVAGKFSPLQSLLFRTKSGLKWLASLMSYKIPTKIENMIKLDLYSV